MVRRTCRPALPVAGLVTVLLAAAGLAGCTSSDPLLRVDAALFTPSFGGDIGLSTTTDTDVTTVNISSDLDLGSTEYVPYLRGEFDIGPFNLAASGFKTSQDGTGTVTADFGDITAGSTVESEIDLTLVQARAVFDVLDLDMVKLGLGLAAEWVDFHFDQREQVFGLSETIDVTQVVPLIAAHGAVGIELPHFVPLRFDVNAAGMSLNLSDLDGTILDVEALLRADFDRVGCFVGYRYILIQTDGNIDDQSVDANVTLAGWIAGVSVRF
jgi:hypothetical protein